MKSPSILEVVELSFAYGDCRLLSDVTFSVASGESVAIMGATGSGKSTLLSCISGMTRPSAGSVVVAGRDVTRMRHRALAEYRRRTLGLVFQFGELLPALTARENVTLPALLDGVAWEQAALRADELLAGLGVPLADTPAASLSGGERQRTALARALMNDPALLVADEPTGSLDTEKRDEVADLLLNRSGAESSALLVVTHDPLLAARADRAYRLEHGRLAPLVAVGS